jgi:predicted nucleotidyltransferase
VVLTNTKERQIQWILTHPDEKVTISGLAVASGTAYPQTYNNVQDLVQQRIFVKESVPPAQIISLHPEIPIDVLVAIETRRKKEFLKKHVWMELMLKDLLNYTLDFFLVFAVFGSYAKGTQNSKSDIDFLLIVPSRKKISLFEHALHKIYTKVKKNVVIVTAEEFIEMIKKTNEFNVGNEAKKHHVLLYGAEQWHSLIKKVQ